MRDHKNGHMKAIGIFRRLMYPAFIGCFVLHAVTAGSQEIVLTDAANVGMSTDRLQGVSSWIEEYVDSNQVSGAVVLVARQGKVVHHQAYGWRYKEKKAPMETDTIFTIMSMTKPIVSVALLTLFEEGKFLLDDPISKWIPEYNEMEVLVRDGPRTRRRPANNPVTIRHVLTHTSGLLTRPTNVTLSNAEQDIFKGDGNPSRTLGEHLRRASVIPLAFHPGEQWQYGSSTDYVALLVERISGKRLDLFLQERIFEPLGMTDTHYYVPPNKLPRVAAVYKPDEEGLIQLRLPPQVQPPAEMFRGVAGLSSTSSDYYRFAQMLLNGGEFQGQRILGRRTVELAISNHIKPDQSVYIRGSGYGFGLGFGVLLDPTQSSDTLSRGSFTWGGAYGTLFWVDPVEDLIGILMVQIRPYSHFDLRPQFSGVVSQAIIDRHPDVPRIMGYLD